MANITPTPIGSISGKQSYVYTQVTEKQQISVVVQASMRPDATREGEDGFQWAIRSFCLTENLDMMLRTENPYCRFFKHKEI